MAITKFSDVLDQCMLDAEKRESGNVEPKIAAAILLIAVIKADGRVDRMEFAEVIDILCRRFNLPADEVGRLLEQASDSVASEHDLQDFTLHLRNAWDQSERLRLLKNFWEIAISDSMIDERERNLIEKLASMLDLPEEDISAARESAEYRLQMQMEPPK